jgi:uncharacterized protein YwqG
MQIDEILANAKKVGFAGLDAIRRLARPGVQLVLRASVAESAPGSRLGGVPALPPSMPWPRRGGKSLSFVAQIDLASLPDVAREQGFPADGLLLFFYDAEQCIWGFDPKDADAFMVLHVPAASVGGAARPFPDDLPKHARFAAVRLESKSTLTLPPFESVHIDDLGLDTDQSDAYGDLAGSTCDEKEWASRVLLGGHPDQIQGNMALECALVTAGIGCGDGNAYEDPRLPEFRARSREWRLLLQVPSADEAGMMWGDAGLLYYWIRDEDLRARRFEKSWMVLQCY